MIDRACDCRHLNSCPHCTLLTVEQAATRSGRRPVTISQWIHRGYLTPIRDRGRTYLLEADFAECERARRHALKQQKLGKTSTEV